MEPGKNSDTGLTEEENLDFLTGQIEACFQPSGSVEVPFIMGVLSLAKQDGLDPESVYRAALQNLHPYLAQNAPPYERVAPKA